MNIRKRMLKVAKKILSDTNFTSMDEFHQYIENHETRPGTKFTVNGVPVTNPNQGKNQGGNGGKIDEQKKLHQFDTNNISVRVHKNRTFLKKILMNNYYSEEKSNAIASKFALDLAKGEDKKKIVEQINNIISRDDIKISEKDLL